MTNQPTAAQPIDLDKLEVRARKEKADGYVFMALKFDLVLQLIALARQQHEPSGNAGEVAASIDSPEFQKLMYCWDGVMPAEKSNSSTWKDIVAHIDAQLARQAAPHASAEMIPQTAEEVVAFIGNHYNDMDYSSLDPANIKFELTVHDLQSAFRWWFDDALYVAPAAPHAQAEPVARKLRDSEIIDICNKVDPRPFRDNDLLVLNYARAIEAAVHHMATPAAVTDITKDETDEIAYAASGYRHFMDFPTFKAFRADCAARAQPAAPAVTDAARDVLTDVVQFDWVKAERIRDETRVDEALHNFREDPTADNATGIIQAALAVWTADTTALRTQSKE